MQLLPNQQYPGRVLRLQTTAMHKVQAIITPKRSQASEEPLTEAWELADLEDFFGPDAHLL